MKYVKIKEINDAGNDSVYHLTVEKNHNFFANKLCVHNCDYRGEVKVILINHGTQPFVIENGERIAQGVIGGVMGKKMITFESVEELSDTERGEGGFGSTGVK